jgi:hypothetical protein
VGSLTVQVLEGLSCYIMDLAEDFRSALRSISRPIISSDNESDFI